MRRIDSGAVDYDLTCWYLNLRRLSELMGVPDCVQRGPTIGSDFTDNLMLLTAYKDQAVAWLESQKISTLGQALVSGSLKVGQIVTHYSDFFFRGLSRYALKKTASAKTAKLPEGYSKLGGLPGSSRVHFSFDPVHLTSASAWEFLSGHHQLFLLAAVDRIGKEEIEVIPYLIASLLPQSARVTHIGARWDNRLEVFVDDIDSFEEVRAVAQPKANDVQLLKGIPEIDIKTAFAEIIGEPIVPPDWGGERSDLYSTFTKLDGRRISSAFIFKGPAKFKPMTMASLGKNGDQIARLFSEPANLVFLQHCHTIEKSVRDIMRAFAQQIGNLKLFAIIDGYDTLRILRAYRKCGF